MKLIGLIHSRITIECFNDVQCCSKNNLRTTKLNNCRKKVFQIMLKFFGTITFQQNFLLNAIPAKLVSYLLIQSLSACLSLSFPLFSSHTHTHTHTHTHSHTHTRTHAREKTQKILLLIVRLKEDENTHLFCHLTNIVCVGNKEINIRNRYEHLLCAPTTSTEMCHFLTNLSEQTNFTAAQSLIQMKCCR